MIDKLLNEFSKIAPYANIADDSLNLQIVDHGCPHKPNGLPEGKMGIYIFIFSDEVLKVGKVGPNTGPRWTSHHYGPKRAPSTLSKSLLEDAKSAYNLAPQGNKLEIGAWMKANLRRIDILVDAAAGNAALAFLEAFLHCRLKPRYEGRNFEVSQ